MGKIIGKIFLSVIVTMAGATPTLIYLGARLLFEPHGFWQEFFLFGVGIWLLGAFQVILAILWIILIIVIWAN